jgi:hypothetical protein
MTMIVFAVIGFGGAVFLTYFFIALCREGRGGTCHIVHVLHESAETQRNPLSKATIYTMPNSRQQAEIELRPEIGRSYGAHKYQEK